MGMNLISHIMEITQIEGVWEQGVQENIWTLEGESGRKLEKSAH
jgi:hypothetical protein